MALYKREVLVRPNSSADFAGAMNWTLNWLNNLQNEEDNKDENGNFIDFYFADVTFAPGHANGGEVWRIFSAACEQKYNMQPSSSGRIEYQIADRVGVRNLIERLQARVANHTRSLNEVGEELSDHEERISALETSDADDGVEATVI